MAASSSPSLLPLLAPQKGKLIAASLFQIVATALGLVPFVVIYSIAVALLHPPVEPAEIRSLVLASFGAVLGRWILTGVAGILAHRAAYNILYEIRITLSEKFAVLPLGHLDQTTTGALKKIINEDVEYLELTIAHGIPDGIGLLATLILTSIYLFTVDWRMALAALSGIPVLLVAQAIMLKRSLPLVEGYYAAKDRMNSTIIEYIQGMPVIKAFTQTTQSFTRYQESVQDYHDYEENWAKQSLLPFTLITLSAAVNLLVILPLGVWLLHQGSLSTPAFILFLLLGVGLSAPVVKLVESTGSLVQTQEGVKRIFGILDQPALPEPETSAAIQDYRIEFKDVRFSYQETEILKGLSFTILPGSVTALVGPSGSGKTTIARLIARFWDVDSGAILLGGVNVKDLKLKELMAKIAIVFQDVALFNDTIYENIRMGNPDASEAAVIAAAKAARCHEFIAALPDGYQTIVGERGARLSGGQKQRISIARAILKDAPIVILDEATAFIDPENEAQIQAAIGQLIQNKTLILIAHRLSTITEADQILVIQAGQLVAQGQHGDLLDRSEVYRQLWEAHVAAQGWSLAREAAIAVHEV